MFVLCVIGFVLNWNIVCVLSVRCVCVCMCIVGCFVLCVCIIEVVRCCVLFVDCRCFGLNVLLCVGKKCIGLRLIMFVCVVRYLCNVVWCGNVVCVCRVLVADLIVDMCVTSVFALLHVYCYCWLCCLCWCVVCYCGLCCVSFVCFLCVSEGYCW